MFWLACTEDGRGLPNPYQALCDQEINFCCVKPLSFLGFPIIVAMPNLTKIHKPINSTLSGKTRSSTSPQRSQILK